jgi:hypothetical protein
VATVCILKEQSMKVYIGPPLDWWGPFRIADLLRYVGVSKARCHKIGEWLNNTPLSGICEWIHERRKRVVKVRVDYYDIWGMDHTIALIALPLLKKLKEKKQGSPHVDDEDVPEHLRSTAAPPLTEEEQHCGSTDNNWHDRWEWVLNEIIWGFENMIADDAGDRQFSADKDPAKPSDEPGISFKEMMDRTTYDFEAYKAFSDRVQNSMCLFGKYLQGMWD